MPEDYISLKVKRNLVVDLVRDLDSLASMARQVDGVGCARGCGATVAHRLAYCAECKRLAEKESRETVQQRKEDTGECVRCPAMAVRGKRYCNVHLAWIRGESRRRYRELYPEVKRIIRCARCAGPGHTSKTCQKPKPKGAF